MVMFRAEYAPPAAMSEVYRRRCPTCKTPCRVHFDTVDGLLTETVEPCPRCSSKRVANWKPTKPVRKDWRKTEETEMPDTEKVREFVEALLEDAPEMDNADVNRHVNKRFDADMSRQQTSAIARFVRKDLEEQPSTNGNGAKPKLSNEGGDQHAEPVSPAGEDDREAQGSGIAEPEQDPAPDAAPAGDPARDRLRKYARAYIAFSLVQDRDLDDPVRTAVRGELYDLEEQLIVELTANVSHADVEKRATELDQLADTLRQRTEGLLNALVREGAVA